MFKKSKTVKESVLKDDVQYLTLEECATYLRINHWTLRRWIRVGIGPPVIKFTSQCVRIAKPEFLTWAQTRGSK